MQGSARPSASHRAAHGEPVHLTFLSPKFRDNVLQQAEPLRLGRTSTATTRLYDA